MSLLDSIRGLFGRGTDDPRESDPEDLLELTGAAITMRDRLGYEGVGEAALCFAAPDAGGFDATIDDLQAVLDRAAESGTAATFRDDEHGYRWLVVEGVEIESLATALQFAAETFREERFEDQLLAAVAGFERDDRRAYWIYSFPRGRYYPFVPDGDHERDAATEFKLQRVLADDLPIEDDRSEWYPLWPDRAGAHPWE